MRGVGAVIALYIFGVALYLGWAQFAKWRHSTVQSEVAANGLAYTNTIQLKERVRVLQDQLDLQYRRAGLLTRRWRMIYRPN